MIKVQSDDFSLEKETKKILNKNSNVGAMSSFIGIVRNKAKEKDLISMTLDHYPGMTEKMLKKIEDEAILRWDLLDTLIIHRYGELYPGNNIVLVITVSKHRKDAIDSCHFLIDWLKTKGPFWKYEKTKNSGHWVEALESDNIEEKKWQN
ncbi:molybdenum cofactor biosynthesis protein MoaE [Alphaproteobacteria bacterium]|nr:molybdenum cofactor biosynthesis protein MoaE [Alphaproteobacteria bacterium]